MENKRIDPETINGWAMDADEKNEPTYPIKNYNGDDHQRINWERPELQDASVEILKSTERPYNSAVFGTTLPPKNISGMIRRIAFKYSENKYRRWLPLILADRINVIEGVIEDLFKGRVPNFYKDTGWSVIAKHNPKLLAKKIAIRLVAIGVLVYLFGKKRK